MKFFLDIDELCNTSELWNWNQKNLLITQKPFNLSCESMCDNKKREWKRGRSWHKKERLKLQSEYSGKAVVWPLLIITYRLCSKQYIFNLLILLAIICRKDAWSIMYIIIYHIYIVINYCLKKIYSHYVRNN